VAVTQCGGLLVSKSAQGAVASAESLCSIIIFSAELTSVPDNRRSGETDGCSFALSAPRPSADRGPGHDQLDSVIELWMNATVMNDVITE
jgi:hypothetical protein